MGESQLRSLLFLQRLGLLWYPPASVCKVQRVLPPEGNAAVA
jgi:hypothetical protein